MELSFQRVLRQSREFQAARRKGLPCVLELQRQQLERLVHHARTHSPFYERLYAKVARSGFDVRDLPVTSKPMIMEHYDEVVTDRRLNLQEVRQFAEDPTSVGRLYEDEFVITNTSGTTGLRGYTAQHAREWETLFALNALKPCHLPVKPGAAERLLRAPSAGVRVAVVAGTGSTLFTVLTFTLMPDFLQRVCSVELVSALLPVDEMVERLNRFGPDRVHGYPTLLEALAHKQLEGMLSIQPVDISSSSERLTARARTAIEKAFGIFPENIYGACESWIMAKGCPRGRMHVFVEGSLLEPVGRDGAPTAPGERSDRILITNLHNFTQPVMRYEMPDSVIPLEGDCPCGSILPSMEVIGREDDTLYCQAPDGSYVAFGPMALEVLLQELQGWSMFQMRQVERNRIRVIFVPSQGENPQAVRDRIYARFLSYVSSHGLGQVVVVEVEPRLEIERSGAGGKAKQIASLVGPPPALEARLTYR